MAGLSLIIPIEAHEKRPETLVRALAAKPGIDLEIIVVPASVGVVVGVSVPVPGSSVAPEVSVAPVVPGVSDAEPVADPVEPSEVMFLSSPQATRAVAVNTVKRLSRSIRSLPRSGARYQAAGARPNSPTRGPSHARTRLA